MHVYVGVTYFICINTLCTGRSPIRVYLCKLKFCLLIYCCCCCCCFCYNFYCIYIHVLYDLLCFINILFSLMEYNKMHLFKVIQYTHSKKTSE